MSTEYVIVIAVEDSATAGVVAAAAAHVAMEQEATQAILVHVLDSHTFATGLFGMTGAAAPILESVEEGTQILDVAEATFRAEYDALERPVPSIARRLLSGNPGTVIPEVAAEVGAGTIIVGARRPHAFGRIAHPDVRSALGAHTTIPVRVAPLQSGATPENAQG